MITEEKSLFFYGDKNWDDYNDPDYVPPFLDQLLANATEEKRAEVLALCGDNLECQFDSLAVGAEFGAESTTTANDRVDQQQTIGTTDNI